MLGAASTALFAFPSFLLINTEVPVLVWLAIVLPIAIGTGAMWGLQACFFGELFGTSVRYSGVGLGYQVSGVLGGGFAPFISATLIAAAGGAPWLVAGYVVLGGVISLVSAYLAPETFQRNLSEERDRKLVAGEAT